MNPKQPKPVDPAAVFVAAEVWAAATGALQRSISAGGTVEDLYVPMAVNAAFTAELYGKCLLLLEASSYCEGHDLQEIFRQLKRPTKERIRKQHKALAPTDTKMTTFNALSQGKPLGLDSLLSLCRNTFETFRYWFENPAFSEYPFALWTFTTCLRDEILSHRPDWEKQDC